MRKIIYIFFVFFIIQDKAMGEYHSIPFKLTEDEAARLAVRAVEGSEKNLKFYDYDYLKNISAPFFVYEGIGPQGGSFGYFAVNPWTGDVWDIWDCKKVSTSSSREMQKQIKHRFTSAEVKQYKQLSLIKSECLN